MDGSEACPYLLFADQTYYANGGWGDFRGAYPTCEAAQQAFVTYNEAFDPTGRVPGWNWYEIVDVRVLQVVDYGGEKYGAWGPPVGSDW